MPLLTVDLGRCLFLNNDEARFPMLAQDILTHGDWLLPQLPYEVYLNKPALLAWLIALVSWPFGRVTDLTAVLPTTLAAAATVAGVILIARRLFGPAAGVYAGLVAMTTQGFVLHARLAMPDMLLTAFSTLAVWMLVLMHEGRRWAWLGLYAFCGLAFWSKGTPGLLPLAVAVVSALVDRRPDRWRRLALPQGVALLGVIIAPWMLIAAGVSASAAHAAVVDNQLWRYFGGSLKPSRWIDPLLNPLGIVFPWIVVAVAAVVEARRAIRADDTDRPKLAFLVGWLAVVIVAPALSGQQRLRYYLPVLPAVAVLIGWWTVAAPIRRVPLGARGRRLIGGGIAAVMLLVLAITSAVPRWRPLGWPLATVTSVALFGVGAAPLFFGTDRAARGRVVVAAAAVAGVLLLVAYHAELGALNAEADYPRLRATMDRVTAPGTTLTLVDIDQLPFVYYLRDRPVRYVQRLDAFETLARSDRSVFGLVKADDLPRLTTPLEVVARASLRGRPVAFVRKPTTP